MKIYNKHTSEKYATIPVYINGSILILPIFPLRPAGQANNETPNYAYWGDPENLDKLTFVVGIGYNPEVGNFVPHSFIDPSTTHGSEIIQSLINRELYAYENPEAAAAEAECRRLREQLTKLRKRYHAKKSS